MLSPYRVIDLSDELGLLLGQILGDLGAEVVQVEPPGGSPARRAGPFDKEELGQERILGMPPESIAELASRGVLPRG